jgi:hypothetical protein
MDFTNGSNIRKDKKISKLGTRIHEEILKRSNQQEHGKQESSPVAQCAALYCGSKSYQRKK